MDSGHYYSFIRERHECTPGGKCYSSSCSNSLNTPESRWFEFNDRLVWPYASDRLPHDTFGGTQV